MDLLIITTSWPFTLIPEFLDDEIRVLADHFDSIVVAPMRPRTSLSLDLPRSVTVDLSLANQLVTPHRLPARSARQITAAKRAAVRNPDGLGCTSKELRANFLKFDWIRQAILGRADSTSVAAWAKSRATPSLAYTFWLGPATVGLRRAWPSIPIVSRVHGGDLFAEASGWSSIPFQRDAIRVANLVASVSEFGRTYLAEKFPSNDQSIVWRPLGIEDVGQAPIPTLSNTIRLVSVSSIDANKRVGLIAEVAAQLAKDGTRVHWTHFGDGPERARLNDYISNGPGTLSVDMKGHVSSNQVREALVSSNFDVFVNLSLSEGAPVSLMEAQSAGLPVVATAVGGTPEVVPDHLNELVSVSSSVQMLATAILRARERPSSERVKRRAAWQINYNAQTNYQGWARELHNLAGRFD